MNVSVCDIQDPFHDQTDKEDDIGFFAYLFLRIQV